MEAKTDEAEPELVEARLVEWERMSIGELLALRMGVNVASAYGRGGKATNSQAHENYKAWDRIEAAQAEARDEIAAARVAARRLRRLDADVPLSATDPRRVAWSETLWARLKGAVAIECDGSPSSETLREVRAELRLATQIATLLAEEQAAVETAKHGAPNPATAPAIDELANRVAEMAVNGGPRRSLGGVA